MRIASDIDHVMCDLVGQARVVLACDLKVPLEDIIQTNVYHRSLVHADPDINALINIDHAFWEREEVMHDALPMPGAVEAAWRLFDEGLLVAYVTRRGPNTTAATNGWLRRNGFPDVPARFVGSRDPATTYANCKTQACLVSGATMLLDDSQEEIERVVDAGLTGVLIDAPVGREARREFLRRRPDILCLPSIVEAVDHLVEMRRAA